MGTEQVKRENPEPTEHHFPLPLGVKVLMVLLTAWGCYYFLSVEERPSSIGDHTQMARSNEVKVDGAQVYTANCLACHQSNGLGLAGVFPPLAQSEWVLTREDRLVQVLLAGLEGPITVLGQNYNGAMPAFGNLSDDEILAVINYIRSSFGNAAPPITIDQVIAGRAIERTSPWLASELDAQFPE